MADVPDPFEGDHFTLPVTSNRHDSEREKIYKEYEQCLKVLSSYIELFYQYHKNPRHEGFHSHGGKSFALSDYYKNICAQFHALVDINSRCLDVKFDVEDFLTTKLHMLQLNQQHHASILLEAIQAASATIDSFFEAFKQDIILQRMSRYADQAKARFFENELHHRFVSDPPQYEDFFLILRQALEGNIPLRLTNFLLAYVHYHYGTLLNVLINLGKKDDLQFWFCLVSAETEYKIPGPLKYILHVMRHDSPFPFRTVVQMALLNKVHANLKAVSFKRPDIEASLEDMMQWIHFSRNHQFDIQEMTIYSNLRSNLIDALNVGSLQHATVLIMTLRQLWPQCELYTKLLTDNGRKNLAKILAEL